eukprot:6341909-Amphidinium_carterae.1
MGPQTKLLFVPADCFFQEHLEIYLSRVSSTLGSPSTIWWFCGCRLLCLVFSMVSPVAEKAQHPPPWFLGDSESLRDHPQQAIQTHLFSFTMKPSGIGSVSTLPGSLVPVAFICKYNLHAQRGVALE